MAVVEGHVESTLETAWLTVIATPSQRCPLRHSQGAIFKSIPVDSVDRPAQNTQPPQQLPQPTTLCTSNHGLQLLNFILRAAAFFVCCLCVSVRACARVCAGSTTLRATHNTSCCASQLRQQSSVVQTPACVCARSSSGNAPGRTCVHSSIP